MPFDTSSSPAPTKIAAYVCTDQGAQVAQAVVEQTGADPDDLHGGGLSGAARLTADQLAGKLILAETGTIPLEMACECVSEIVASGADVIVLGAQADIDTYRALLRAGALEYFTYPVSAADILNVRRPQPAPVAPAPQPVVAAAAPVRSPVIGVMGTNGGVGSSLLAQNLAHYAADAKGGNRKTALLDADLLFGSQAIDLDRDQTAGLFEALKAPDRVDATFISATMDHLDAQLSLYSNQVHIGQDAAPFEAGLSRIIEPLCGEFGAVVVDVPRTLAVQNPALIAKLDVLVVVIAGGFAGVNAASRLITKLKNDNADLRILPVLSQVRHDAGLSAKDVTTATGLPVTTTLPACAPALARAQRAATALVKHQPRAAYAASVRTLWRAANAAATPDAPAKAPRRGLMKRILG